MCVFAHNAMEMFRVEHIGVDVSARATWCGCVGDISDSALCFHAFGGHMHVCTHAHMHTSPTPHITYTCVPITHHITHYTSHTHISITHHTHAYPSHTTYHLSHTTHDTHTHTHTHTGTLYTAILGPGRPMYDVCQAGSFLSHLCRNPYFLVLQVSDFNGKKSIIVVQTIPSS